MLVQVVPVVVRGVAQVVRVVAVPVPVVAVLLQVVAVLVRVVSVAPLEKSVYLLPVSHRRFISGISVGERIRARLCGSQAVSCLVVVLLVL